MSYEAENGVVTLWGTVIDEDATHLKFAMANVGMAKELGLCGEHTFAKRQIHRRGGPIDRLDFIVVSYALAKLKAQSCQPCD